MAPVGPGRPPVGLVWPRFGPGLARIWPRFGHGWVRLAPVVGKRGFVMATTTLLFGGWWMLNILTIEWL